MSASNIPGTWPLTWDSLSAPGRTRTCDLLLRRQLLYPTELRAPGTTLCMPKVTCRPQAGSLFIATADPIDEALTLAEQSREICSPHPRQPASSMPWPCVRPKSGRRTIRRSRLPGAAAMPAWPSLGPAGCRRISPVRARSEPRNSGQLPFRSPMSCIADHP